MDAHSRVYVIADGRKRPVCDNIPRGPSFPGCLYLAVERDITHANLWEDLRVYWHLHRNVANG